ncbi:MAG: tetratricopeptide repeat protein, partial [Ignavibacterium sp.]
KLWEDRYIDLRVEDHSDPISEIKRLLKVFRAYEHMNNGDLAVEKNDMKLAMEHYSAAMKMFPENLEMKYWTAVTLVNTGQLDNALPLFKEIFAADDNWRKLTPRLIKNGLLNADEKTLQTIMNQ